MSGPRSLEFQGVSVNFAGRMGLTDLSIVLDHHRIAVIGSNGSGKSTFARMLNGLVTASNGEVRIHGLDPVREAKALRRRVGFIFSNPDAQIVMPTVTEDLEFSLRGSGLTGAQIAERVLAMLVLLDFVPLAEAPAHALSGGQKQLLALGAILIGTPQLIVADEPTALLDAANTRRIGNLLIDTIEQQLVLVTHDLRLAARCDIVLRFEHGRLVEHGDPQTVISRYEADHA